MANNKWVVLAIIGGILMFLSSVIGSASFFALVFNIMAQIAGEEVSGMFGIVLQIFTYIAAGGGISVIIGALIVARGKRGLGKFIISLGAGIGLIGLIVFLITSIMGGSILTDLTGMYLAILNGSYGFLGVVITIFARLKMKKEKDEAKD